jgi:hypothetical protein
MYISRSQGDQYMHFTLLFKSFSLSANFVPCLSWTSSSDLQHIPHPECPYFKKGDLLEAILHFGLDRKIENRQDKVLVIVHESSECGEESDLNQLVEDCQTMANEVQVIAPWNPQDPMYKYLFTQKVTSNDE